jgi:hypothetical protein
LQIANSFFKSISSISPPNSPVSWTPSVFRSRSAKRHETVGDPDLTIAHNKSSCIGNWQHPLRSAPPSTDGHLPLTIWEDLLIYVGPRRYLTAISHSRAPFRGQRPLAFCGPPITLSQNRTNPSEID